MRESVGEVQCRYCDEGQLCEVRKNEKGKLYLYCRECGIHHLNTVAGQNWILNNATLYGSEGKPAAATPKPRQAPPPKPQPKPEPVPASSEGQDDGEEDEF